MNGCVWACVLLADNKRIIKLFLSGLQKVIFPKYCFRSVGWYWEIVLLLLQFIWWLLFNAMPNKTSASLPTRYLRFSLQRKGRRGVEIALLFIVKCRRNYNFFFWTDFNNRFKTTKVDSVLEMGSENGPILYNIYKPFTNYCMFTRCWVDFSLSLSLSLYLFMSSRTSKDIPRSCDTSKLCES